MVRWQAKGGKQQNQTDPHRDPPAEKAMQIDQEERLGFARPVASMI